MNGTLNAVRWADISWNQPGQPEGLTADSSGNIYAASFELTGNFQPPFDNNIYVWNPNGQLVSTTHLPTGAVPLGNVVVGNTLYQIDVWNGDILRYDLPLTNLSTPTRVYDVAGGFAALFGGPGVFSGFNAIDVGPDGRLFISDNGASDFGQNEGNIYYLNPSTGESGIFFDNPALNPGLSPSDPPGSNPFPGFGVNGVAVSPDGSALFFANMSTDTIYRLNFNGNVLSVFAQGGPIDGPDNIDFDNNGLLWVASGQNDQVVALNPQGQVVQVIGSFGGLSSDGAPIGLLQPSGIVFSQGNIYIGNESNPTLRRLNSPTPMIVDPTTGARQYQGLDTYTIARIQNVSGNLNSQSVHRFFDPVTGDHFYTANEDERNAVDTNLPNYIYEGVGFNVPAQSPFNVLPVYRFYNPVSSDHFYTANEQEKNTVIANLADYVYEGIGFSAYSADANLGSDVYRFYNPTVGDHFYTASVSERDYVLNSLPQYHYEGVAFESNFV